MNKYQKGKGDAQQSAIDWQQSLRGCESWGETAEAQARFERLGKRYGLTREFRENGII